MKRFLFLFAFLFLAMSLLGQVNPTGQHGVDLKWTASPSGSSVTGYNVKRGTAAGGPYVTIGSVASTALAFTDGCPANPPASCSSPQLVEGSTFFYVVTATGPGGESGNSNETAAKIPVFIPPPPSVPQGLSGVVH